MNVTLVIPRLATGGASRSAIDTARMLAKQSKERLTQTLVVLGDCTDSFASEATDAGIPVLRAERKGEAERALVDADLVHVQFWNTPEMYAWLCSPQPAMRLIITLHVAGEFPAQILTRHLLEFADWVLPTTDYSLELPEMREALERRTPRVRVILPGRIMPAEAPARAQHPSIRVAYAGTVDFVKLHEQFVEMCAKVGQPHVEFPVVGRGDAYHTLKRQAAALGIGDKFAWLGYRSDILEMLASFDILGYPLAREAYATGDLILQEAMWQGVPPVILAHGALPHLVQDGETGIVARDPDEYADAIRRLCENEEERKRLGTNARAYARRHFGADKSAIQLGVVYDAAMQEAKRERRWQGFPIAKRFPGASALIESFGAGAGNYVTSLQGTERGRWQRADGRIANAPPLQVSAGAGGVLDYRRTYPEDAYLRLWSGLILGQQGRFALAAGEFQAAARLGPVEERARDYMAKVMKHEKPFGRDGE
jgi:glycosyltransferase involved in cell wall biosynthesis